MRKNTTAGLAAAGGAAVIIAAAATGALLGTHSDAVAVSPTVPDEFAPYVAAGAGECETVDAPLLAGVLDATSRFDTEATGGAGQEGPAQFLPATWDVMGFDVDEDGQIIDVPGTGDPRDPGDATTALARLLCTIAADQEGPRSDGTISGDRVDLVLAAHVAGEQAVLDSGGVPPYAEVRDFLTAVDTARSVHGGGQ